MEITSHHKELLKQINEVLTVIQRDDSPEHTDRFRELSRQYYESYGRSALGDIWQVREEK